MRVAVICVILAFAGLTSAPTALADGDPASDVLVSFTYFDPIGLPLPAATSGELSAVLAASRRAGFPIRVALIASQGALGTVTSLWRQPVTYAHYLYDEIANLVGGQILVVMPNGFGLVGASSGPNAVNDAELGVRALAPGPGVQLAEAAISAVPRLAAAAGHPIPAAQLDAALHTVAREPTVSAGTAPLFELLTFALGIVLIAAAWTASLRARPWRARVGPEVQA